MPTLLMRLPMRDMEDNTSRSEGNHYGQSKLISMVKSSKGRNLLHRLMSLTTLEFGPEKIYYKEFCTSNSVDLEFEFQLFCLLRR